MKLNFRKTVKHLAIFAAASAVTVAVATSASTGTEFDGIVNKMIDWLQGGLGKLFALGALAIGLGIGLVQQSVLAIALGIGMALAAYYGPDVIQSLFSAALSV